VVFFVQQLELVHKISQEVKLHADINVIKISRAQESSLVSESAILTVFLVLTEVGGRLVT